MLEIERKFLIQELPDLQNIPEIKYERCFLEINPDREIRIQKKGGIYEKEVKTKINTLKFTKTKQQISQEEFKSLQKQSIGEIFRSSYKLSNDPDITLKIYSGRFRGLNRLEVEFSTEKQADEFIPESWYGKEITGTLLANDSKLIRLSDIEFIELLSKNLLY